MRVREAVPGELAAVMNVLDGALLSVPLETVEDGIGDGRVLVAVAEDRVLGVVVFEETTRDDGGGGGRILGIGVRRRRRGQGIGRALVAGVVDRVDRVSARFDDRARPFYEALGFTIQQVGEDHYRGWWAPDGATDHQAPK